MKKQGEKVSLRNVVLNNILFDLFILCRDMHTLPNDSWQQFTRKYDLEICI